MTSLDDVLDDPRFREAWQNYTEALAFNAGTFPGTVAAARTIAAACGAWMPAHALGSDDDWDAALRQRFPSYFGDVVSTTTWPDVCPTCGERWAIKSKTMGAAHGQPHSGRCVNGHWWNER